MERKDCEETEKRVRKLKGKGKKHGEDERKNGSEEEKQEPYQAPAPYPHRLKAISKPTHQTEIYELFKQVKVNIPLLDAIRQVPSYAKFLKDLCTVKRRVNVSKKAFLTKQVSSIL